MAKTNKAALSKSFWDEVRVIRELQLPTNCSHTFIWFKDRDLLKNFKILAQKPPGGIASLRQGLSTLLSE